MAKKAKEETIDLFYSNAKNKKEIQNKKAKKSNKSKKKSVDQKNKIRDTKEEKFDFSEEIVIGLTRIEDEPKKNKKKKEGQREKEKLNKKKSTTKMKSKQKDEEILVSDIYSKQNEKKLKNKKGKKQKNNIKKPVKKLTKKQELARKKRKAIFRLLRWTTLICMIIGGGIFFLLSPIFNIKTISVKGNSKISSDEIISLSSIEIEQNTFQYRVHDIEEAIKKNAYMEKVKVNRKFPDTIEITVSEREATYQLPIANAYAYIDNQGYILEISDKEENIPLIIGITTQQENIQPGNRLDIEDLKKINDVLKIMESANSNEMMKLITKIDITDSEDYILRLEEKKKTVHLGDVSNLSTKMLWIIKFNEEEENTPGEIFLNMNLNNENNKPYFRKKV